MTLERARLGLLAALAATIPVSIFASELLLLLSVVLLAVRILRRSASFPRTPLDGPLLALVVWTLLAASFASEPLVAHEESKKLVLFALLYVAVETLALREERERVLAAALVGGLAQSGLMLMQRYALGFDALTRRPPGFLGHYMSAAGVTMALLLLAIARLATGPRRARASGRSRAAPGRAAGRLRRGVRGGARARSDRDARVRAGARRARGLRGALARRPRPRGASGRPVRGAAVRRLGSRRLADAQRVARDGLRPGRARRARTASRATLGLAGARRRCRARAARPRRDPLPAHARRREQPRPLLHVAGRPRHGDGAAGVRAGAGHGRGDVPALQVARGPESRQPHLHNNVLQIAAERGLPGLVFFLWWVGVAFLAALREARRAAIERRGPRWAAAGALAALSAVFVAGLFEYNLGDSEVLMLVLLLTAVPFATRREPAPA